MTMPPLVVVVFQRRPTRNGNYLLLTQASYHIANVTHYVNTRKYSKALVKPSIYSYARGGLSLTEPKAPINAAKLWSTLSLGVTLSCHVDTYTAGIVITHLLNKGYQNNSK